MKKIILSFTLLLLLVGCGKNSNTQSKNTGTTHEKKQYYSYLDHLDKKGMQSSNLQFSLVYDTSNPEVLKKISSHIFIARVISLDKSDLYFDAGEKEAVAAFPHTFGKLEILTNILGTTAKEVQFVRFGGIMKEKDLYRKEHKEFVEKLNRNRKKNGIPLVEESDQLVEKLAADDFHLTAGEVYLFYAAKDKNSELYGLIGFSDGALPLEEENQPIEKKKLHKDEIGKSWKIKNKRTGKKEVLGEYLEKRAKIKVKKK